MGHERLSGASESRSASPLVAETSWRWADVAEGPKQSLRVWLQVAVASSQLIADGIRSDLGQANIVYNSSGY